MSWKKFSETFFNQAYFSQLVKRYLWLIYVPLTIFLGFIFLCGMLSIQSSVLGLLLFPYAVCIVPSVALLVFSNYTKKNEISHLLSIPMTRIQQFISAYLAGLCLIVVPLMLMSIFYAITALNEYIITFILGMFFLAVIYFTLSVLGCVLGGTFATQMMMMATISFGPLMLYAMIELCVNLLALGNMDGGLNFNLVMLICPLISASDFIMTAHWDYWFIHLLGTFMIFGLCLYLVKKRPFELSGEANVFYHAQVFLMRPLLYLNFVYLIFYFCSLNFFMTGRFDTKYYFQIIALLVGIGFLVEFIFDIWFSEGLHTLLTIKNVQRSLMMLLLACSLFLIPLWQRERSRTHYSNQAVSVTLHLSSDYDCK